MIYIINIMRHYTICNTRLVPLRDGYTESVCRSKRSGIIQHFAALRDDFVLNRQAGERVRFKKKKRLRDSCLACCANIGSLWKNCFQWVFKEDYATTHTHMHTQTVLFI